MVMKKIGLLVGCLVMVTMLFCACGTEDTNVGLNELPPATEGPIATATPTEVADPEQTSESTQIPGVTASPALTEAPTPTEVLKVTAAPTEVPKATATPTEVPKVTEAPTPTAVLKATATPTPKAEERLTYDEHLVYDAANLQYHFSDGGSYTAGKDGSIDLQFEHQWAGVRLLIPETVDLNQCMYVSVTMNTYGNDISFSLFDEKAIKDPYADSVDARYGCFEKGTTEYYVIPNSGKKARLIGFYAADKVNHPATYKVTVYQVTFFMQTGKTVEIPAVLAPDVTDDMTLRSTYGKDFGYLGDAVELAELKNEAFLEVIKNQYNSVTAAWQMKMNQLLIDAPSLISVAKAKELGYVIPDNYKESVVPQFNFAVMDEMLKICAENDLKVRFHTLVWNGQALDWFFRKDYTEGAAYVAPEVMDARLEYYIRTVMKHVLDGPHGHVVYAWDVVNEYLHYDDLDTKNWTMVYGKVNTEPAFVKLAFEIADDMLRERGLREKVSLFYNDYNTYATEWDGRYTTENILKLVAFLNSDKKICDGVGMQAHLWLDEYPNWRADFNKAVQAFLNAGLEVQLTEVDVALRKDNITEYDQEDAYVALMADMLKLKRAGGNITGITFWGMVDSTLSEKEYQPLLFHNPLEPKNAYYRMLQAYVDRGEIRESQVARPTPTPIPTKAPDPNGELTFTFDEMKSQVAFDGSYDLTEDGSVQAQFNRQWAQAIYSLPQGVDLSQCKSITVKAKSETYRLGVKLFHEGVFEDPWSSELCINGDCHGEGVIAYPLNPEMNTTVWGIGLMAMDEVADFSKYTAEVYSITFHMK